MVASILCLARPCNYCCNSVHDATVKVGAACITTVPCSVGRPCRVWVDEYVPVHPLPEQIYQSATATAVSRPCGS